MRSNVKSKWVVIFGYPWTDTVLYGIGNIILKFHQDGNKILWINPLPNRNLSIKSFNNNKTLLLKRIKRKLFLSSKILKKKDTDFYITSPIYIPIVENSKIEKINYKLLSLQFSLLKLYFRINSPIFITTRANIATNIVQKSNKKLWIHHAGDLFSDLRKVSHETREKIKKFERTVFNNADIILAASINIKEKISTISRNVYYFPHGSDYEHFSNVSVKCNPKIFENIPKPIIGYFGSLTEANDQTALVALAEAGYSIVLIGDVLADYTKLKKYSNIYFIGPIEYSQLPCYAQHFDVGLLNWYPGEWINNCNPKKTFEYLSLGIPIVSTKIPQLITELKEYIYFAEDSEDFPNKVKIAIQENNNKKIRARKLKAKNESWNTRFEFLKKIMEYI